MTTQRGIWNSGPSIPCEYSRTAMIPMVFCASLPPCPSEYRAAEMNCSVRKVLSTANGVARTNVQETIRTRTSARKNPVTDESTIAAVVFVRPDHTMAPLPALAKPAPTKPPISACELLDGIPAHQVITFQAIAPTSAAKITSGSTISGAMIPVPTVLATCSPKNRNATKLKNAAQKTAYWGRNTLVDTIVAIEFAASCRPFRKSNKSATAIRAISKDGVRLALIVSVL